MRYLLLIALLLGKVPQDPLAAKTLDKLRPATCMVWTLKKGNAVCSASGFLFSKEGDTGIVVTSSAAIIPDPSLPEFVIQVVLNSGQPDQKVLPGFLLA